MSSGSASLLDVVAIVAVVVVLAVAVLAFLMRRAGSHPYQAAVALLSPAERSLLDALRQAVGAEYEVFPKVQLAEVLAVRRKGVTRKQRAAAADEVARRRAGFVVCDAASQAVLAVVETEEPRRRRASRHGPAPFLDAALAAAHIPLVRVPLQESYAADELRDRVNTALRSGGDRAAEPRGRLVRLMEAAAPVAPVEAEQGGVVGRSHGRRKRTFVAEGLESAATWLPTRGVLAVAAVILIAGAVLSWFIEGPTPPPSSPPAPKAAAEPPARPAKLAKPAEAKPVEQPAETAPAAEPKEEPVAVREIVGYRDVRVPGRPLEECMGPDREINPEVLRCRDGYTVREPIYR